MIINVMIINVRYCKNPRVRSQWFKNLLVETCHFNTQKYKNQKPYKIKQVLICGLKLNYDKHFNQGV